MVWVMFSMHACGIADYSSPCWEAYTSRRRFEPAGQMLRYSGARLLRGSLAVLQREVADSRARCGPQYHLAHCICAGAAAQQHACAVSQHAKYPETCTGASAPDAMPVHLRLSPCFCGVGAAQQKSSAALPPPVPPKAGVSSFLNLRKPAWTTKCA